MSKRVKLLIVGLTLLLMGFEASALPPQPEYWPVCTDPQNIAPIQHGGGSNLVYGSPVVWNGKDFAILYIDDLDNSVHFRRFFADGTPAMDALLLFPAANGGSSALVWNGNGYAVAYQYNDGTHYVIKFCRLSVEGMPIDTPIQISFYGEPSSGDCWEPAIAWSGAGYAVAWADDRSGTWDIYATILNNDGTIANAGSSHDILICGEAGSQLHPSLLWEGSKNRYFLVWSDSRSGSIVEIYGGELHPLGVPYAFGLLVSDISTSSSPDLVDTGTYLGMVWQDHRDGNNEIYFARINPSNYTKIGSDLNLTNDTANSGGARIVWTGAEYGVFWSDDSAGEYDYNSRFQRISPAGVPQGGNIIIESASGLGSLYAAFANYGYLLTGKFSAYANFVIPWGCAAVDMPTCPGGFVAYNITGTTATIGWLPSSDANQDIAYYQVYRDAVPIAKTSSTFYQDTGLNLSSTYAYAVQPVSAGQAINTSCQTTIYVKTNATLTLMLAKNGNDADLSWTDASLCNYNIFKGTSPQVMHKIGSTRGQTYSDQNALLGSNIYYYSVDDTGL